MSTDSDDFVPLAAARRMAHGRPTAEGVKRSWIQMAAGRVNVARWIECPPPRAEWVVAGLVPAKAVTLLSGDGGTGKSTLALQLAASVVRGAPWLGREVMSGRALIVSCEDDQHELQRRFQGIADGEGFDLADLVEGLEVFDRVDADSAVLTRGKDFGTWEESEFFIGLSNFIRDFAPTLVVLDSLYDFFSGNQLSMADARVFMARLHALAVDAGAAIVVLWHPSQSGMASGEGTSGNKGFRNKARSMLYLEVADPEAKDGARILHHKKCNFGPEQQPFGVRWEGGRFVLDAPDLGGTVGRIERRNADRAAGETFLACLDRINAQGRHASAARSSPAYAPRLFEAMREAGGMKRQRLERALEFLLDEGAVRIGRKRKPNRHFTEAILRADEADDE